MNHVSPAAPPLPAHEAILERLHVLHPQLIDLSLGRLERLLEKLGHPERRLPPVIHVAGTNGKGSTCAFLRAIAEAAGMRAHVYTSPHLVQVNERFVVAGAEIADALLADTLAEIEAVNAGDPITVFEVLTAAAFLLFARVPAELAILEVGLGGRFDATNVILPPAACAITSISVDHREFLGDTVERIAAEKAGIFKPGAPAVTGEQSAAVLAVLDRAAAAVRVRLDARDRDFFVMPDGESLVYADPRGRIALPLPSLPGAHQADNAAVAVAALRAAGLGVADAAVAAGVARALAGTAAAAARGIGGAVARILGAVVGRRPQSGRRARAGAAHRNLARSARASDRRHETDEGRGAVPRASLAARR